MGTEQVEGAVRSVRKDQPALGVTWELPVPRGTKAPLGAYLLVGRKGEVLPVHTRRKLELFPKESL